MMYMIYFFVEALCNNIKIMLEYTFADAIFTTVQYKQHVFIVVM